MTITELKEEASKHGYILIKRNKRKLLPCKCGGNRRNHIWCGPNLTQIKLVCKKCGYEAQPGYSKYQAELNWNDEMKSR